MLTLPKLKTQDSNALSVAEYARLVAPEPEVLRIIGEESKRNGTNKLSSKEIDQIIAAARRSRTKR